MGEVDHTELVAEILRRLLRTRLILDDDEFDHLAGEIMISMGVAAMRKAEGQARRRQAVPRPDHSGKVINFPFQNRQILNETAAKTP
ncbi:hypothetical protein [Methylobacterium sp. GC_Met_2]|uniref:hypothetical protein n=1 Tax=Methylobacterium sp. GC_Met_2 TaxID=2937376 RepID=UPI00226BAE68|nr:hypothetical protein [Methylobacterium sp. GC_Met_2]